MINGKRILDLGCNNGVMSLMMLRAGAESVVGVELSPEVATTARQFHKVFEWRDMRGYDLTVQCADMKDVFRCELGSFDLVTAFASLYYLDEADMVEVAKMSRDIAPVMVIQAKSDTRSSAAGAKAAKSKPEFLRQVLLRAGFENVEQNSKEGYNRPILVGS
jgi:SAM-dependent methyltransferase